MTQNRTPDSEAASNRSSVTNVLGIASGLIGSLFALVTLTTPLLKLAGVLACVTVAMVLWQAARDRAHGQLSTALMWQLAAAGVFVLALVVLLGAQPATQPRAPGQGGTAGDKPVGTSGPSPVATPAPSPTTTGTASPVDGTSPAPPGPTWLADMGPVDGGDGWEPGTAVVDSRRFEHSVIVGTCFDAEDVASYQLGGNYQKVTATVRLAENAPTAAKLKLTVLADDRQVFSKVVGVGSTIPLDVAVAGAHRLVMRVEALDTTPCDNRDLVLGNAQVTR